MNIDPIEIEKFSQHAQDWWDSNGELKTLHQVNPLRVQFVLKMAGTPDGKKILDVGCGGGILTEALAKEGAIATGLDMAELSLEVAAKHACESGVSIDYLCDTVEHFASSHNEQFDIVTCMEMLEHVPDPVSVIKSCAQLVKKDGWVFFSTLNRNLKSYFLSVIMAEHVLKILPKGIHEYGKFIKPYELVKAASNYQLNPKKLVGIKYNPLTQKMTFSDNADVNYIIAFQKAT